MIRGLCDPIITIQYSRCLLLDPGPPLGLSFGPLREKQSLGPPGLEGTSEMCRVLFVSCD